MSDNWQLQRVLVIQLDSVSIELALQKLRQLLPAASITLMTTASQPPELFWIDDVLIYKEPVFDNPEQELKLIEQLTQRHFDAAIIFTTTQSPYPIAYMCYLAGIPIRVGRSPEFGGSVLSHWVKSHSDTDLADQQSFLHLISSPAN
ncbi:hypothetical protein [Gloeocapsopsis sp. IPPAS B-1203]|uniref:glycosyltransferase family 9 protein n=1 Tax=Gloeocapsopsis sp. IPPAS B-1203 TaxID=2049454 RepID=UPI0025A0651A|nr:hypothetical protein [Gloeocapsopsis sp. IPPAS B-1203]